MGKRSVSTRAGLVLAWLATASSFVLASSLLFADVTTMPGSTEPAGALEAGNVALAAFAVLPLLVAAIGLVSAYRGRTTALAGAGGLLAVLGVLGLQVGFFYLAIGLGLVVSYVLVEIER